MNNNVNEFYKKNESDLIWWLDNHDKIGEYLFSFDKKTIFNLFQDYPYKLTKDEKKIFDKENPDWVDFFKDRNKSEGIDKVDEIIEPIEEKKKILYSIAETVYKKIEELSVNSEFTIEQFLKDYELESKEKFELCEQIIYYCLVNNVKLKEKYPDSDLGLPWNIPRIKLN